MPNRTLLAAVVAGLLLGAPAVQAALLVNGDFEAATSAYGLPPGWDGSTAALGGPLNSPNLFVASGADYVPCCMVTGSPASMANRFVTFGAADAPHGGGVLTQSFATGAGVSYALRFEVAAFGVVGTQTLRVRVTDTSTLTLLALHDIVVASNNNLDTAFGANAFAFTAVGAQSRLAFENVSTITDNIDAALDNVSITPRAAVDVIPVPEPATWSFLLAGFACLGVSLRRRQSAAGLRIRRGGDPGLPCAPAGR